MQYSLAKTCSAAAVTIAAIGFAAPASAAINCDGGGTSADTSPCTVTVVSIPPTLTVSVTEQVMGSLEVLGNLTVKSGGTLVFQDNPGSLDVSGTLVVEDGGTLDAKGAARTNGRALNIWVGSNASIDGTINTEGGGSGNTGNAGSGAALELEIHGLVTTGSPAFITSSGGGGGRNFNGGSADDLTILACSAYIAAANDDKGLFATGGGSQLTVGSGAAILLHTTEEITLLQNAIFEATKGGSGTGGTNGSITLKAGTTITDGGAVFAPAANKLTGQPGPFLCSVTTGFGKVSGGIGYGTIPKRGNSPSHTFDGFVAEVGDAITINYRHPTLKTECTFTATSVVFDAIDLEADIDADYTCTGGQTGTATIVLTGRGDANPQDYRGSIAVDATPHNALDIPEQPLETGNVIVAIID